MAVTSAALNVSRDEMMLDGIENVLRNLRSSAVIEKNKVVSTI
jgi:hypothetical protein